MPEGDTVFRTAARLREVLDGNRLRRGELRHPRLSTLDLAGREVAGVRTVGKHLFVRFDRNLSLHNHLGMDGSWQIYPTAGRWRKPSHQARAVLATEQHQAVGFLLQELALVATDAEDTLVAHLGPDLLAPDWSPEHVATAVRLLTADPTRQLGDALLDQRVMAGVGNVYKTEVCFLLGVSPWTPVADVDPTATVDLCRDLLHRNRLDSRRNTTGDPRPGRDCWVYGRTRTGCLRCGGPVRTSTQGPRTRERVTYHCPHCQPGPTT